MTQLVTSPDLWDVRNKRLDSRFAYKLGENQYGLDFIDATPAIDEARMSIRLCFADGSRRDGVGDITEVAGIRCERHRMNPISLFNHGKEVVFPIGMCEDPETKAYTVEIDPIERKACATIFFYTGKSLPKTPDSDYQHALFCEQIFDLIAKGFIRGASFGYQTVKTMPLSPDYTTDHAPPIPGHHLLVTVLLEAGPVIMPCNGDTLVQKMLNMPAICGKPPCGYLVKSLQPYAMECKEIVVSGFEKSLGEYIPLGAKVRITGGENAGRTATVDSQIPKRYRKEANVYRVTLDGQFVSPSAAKTTVEDRFMERIKSLIPGQESTAQRAQDMFNPGWAGKMKKDCGVIRTKYRKSKGLRHVRRKSSPGTSLVYAKEIDLQSIREMAKMGGVKCEHCGPFGNLAKVRLTGADEVIEDIARKYGKAIHGRKQLMATKGGPGSGRKRESRESSIIGYGNYDPHRSNVKEMPSEDISPEKARQILKDGEVRGHKLTAKQRGMFGAAAGKDKKTLSGVAQTTYAKDVPALRKEAIELLKKYIETAFEGYRERAWDALLESGLNLGGIARTKQGAEKLIAELNKIGSKSMKYKVKAATTSPSEGDGSALPEEGGHPEGQTDYEPETGEKDLEPYGAGVLRRIHEHHSILLQEYDEAMQVLENEGVKKHLQKILEGVSDILDSTESLFEHEYGESEGVEPLEGKDMGETEDVSDNVESEQIERPKPEEAVEGMMTNEEKQLIWAAHKVLRNQYGKKALKNGKKNFLGDETGEVEITKPKGKLNYSPNKEPMQQHTESIVPGGTAGSKAAPSVTPGGGHEPGTEAQDGSSLKIHPLEAASVNNAKAFLKDLSDLDEGFDDEKRMMAFHFCKILDPIGERFESFFKNFASDEDIEVEITKPSGPLDYSPNKEPMQQHTESIVPGGTAGNKAAPNDTLIEYPENATVYGQGTGSGTAQTVFENENIAHGQGVGGPTTEGDGVIHGQGVPGKALWKAIQEASTFFKDLTVLGLKWNRDHKAKAGVLYANLKNFVSDETGEVEITKPSGPLDYSPNKEPMQQHTESIVPGGTAGSKGFQNAVLRQNKQINDLDGKIKKLLGIK